MAALDFPASPTDGQVYNNWVYNTAKGAWKAKPLTPGQAQPSATAPTNPSNGDQWYNTNDGNLYIYYNDGNTSQWVQVKSDVSFTSTFGTRLTTLETYPSGLVPIVPTSVAVGSGTGTSDSGGLVTFSGASYVRLNGVFTSAFANYKLVAYQVNVTTGTSITGRFSVNGTDDTNSVYNYQGTNQAGTGAVTNWQFTATSLYFGNGAGDSLLTYDISNPAVAARTKLNGQTAGYTAANAAWALSMMHDSSTIFDGFNLFCGTGTFNGKIKVYGYK